jgi:deoxyribodipyrimidine photo-lyase
VEDNPAWAAATLCADRIVALFVLDPFLIDVAGPFRRNQLMAHLHGLDQRLQREGGRLLVRRGDPTRVVPEIARASGADVVYANADVTPYARQRDESVKAVLGDDFQRWWGTLIHSPGSVTTTQGHTPRVFTQFFNKWRDISQSPWLGARPAHVGDDVGTGLPNLDCEPFQAGGEEAAMDRLFDFANRVDDYEVTRDRPDIFGTSGLSTDLHFGTLAPRTVARVIGTATSGRAAFVRQLAWRDWYAHLLWETPALVSTSMRTDLAHMQWRNDPDEIEAWRHGLTGYPLVDAGMRQLACTGWMHNRVRMIVGSFLVKDLLVDWRIGERWFRRLLVDGDVAQNVGNWQWVAGTGPDAAPYFRVFNPVLQSRKFDPEGDYIKRFVPELSTVPTQWIHAPWTAPPLELERSGVALGVTYPTPIVDHAFARTRALATYGAISRNAGR